MSSIFHTCIRPFTNFVSYVNLLPLWLANSNVFFQTSLSEACYSRATSITFQILFWERDCFGIYDIALSTVYFVYFTVG